MPSLLQSTSDVITLGIRLKLAQCFSSNAPRFCSVSRYRMCGDFEFSIQPQLVSSSYSSYGANLPLPLKPQNVLRFCSSTLSQLWTTPSSQERRKVCGRHTRTMYTLDCDVGSHLRELFPSRLFSCHAQAFWRSEALYKPTPVSSVVMD